MSGNFNCFVDFVVDQDGRGENESAMGKYIGISHVLRSVLGRTRERLTISIHGLQEWQRSLPNSLHISALYNRQIFLLHEDGSRTVY